MSVLRIAWRSIQYRGLGSLLTILSMALGVMTVVAVLTIHGVVARSFHANSSFGYDVIVGSRGGSMQLTLNTVYYLSRPLEPVPYEYYLTFLDQKTREPFLRNSIAYRAHQAQQSSLELVQGLTGGFGLDVGQTWVSGASRHSIDTLGLDQLTLNKDGEYAEWVDAIIPLTLGDYFSRALDGTEGAYRVVGTTSDFFDKLVLDVDTEKKFAFAQGRALRNWDTEHGFYECVVGSQVARDAKVFLGESIYAIHGEVGKSDSHFHKESGFTVVGILESTGTPHDRAVFVNIEGFYLMEDHAKPIEEGREFASNELDESEMESNESPDPEADAEPAPTAEAQQEAEAKLRRQPLPMEQREITALLIRSNDDDGTGAVGGHLIDSINGGGFLEPSLSASMFRPIRVQVEPQAVNPIREVSYLFMNIVDPIRWVLLGLTILICIVSGISILVGIYNSMNQRRHEIAVLRALGARRTKVTQIMLAESVMLSLAGGLFGWIAGHALNAALSPIVEARTGVRIGLFDFAPPVNWADYLSSGNSQILTNFLQYLSISPEFLLIPGMILLAILVGVYPAISAYRTDVAKSLGS